MYNVSKRAKAVLLLIGILILGMIVYLVRFVMNASTWAAAPFNQAAYSGGMLTAGTVTDRNGVILAGVSENRRTFAPDYETRLSTVHAVGDKEGNVGTGALRVYASELMGYNLITGSYSMGDNRGNTIALTIDSSINTVAYRALDGRRGVVMVSNYETGEIMCMVSTPAFDPSDPPIYIEDESGIYLNRAIQAAYTPGSTFKIVTASAAIEQIGDIYERQFQCNGSFEAGSDTVTCNGVHGSLDFVQALRVSCNVVFGQLAIELGAECLADYTDRYDLSGSISIDDMTTFPGNFDMAPPGTADLAWSGVGQYTNMVCPATMLRYVGAIANGGRAMELNLLKETGISSIIPNSSSRILSESTAQLLGDAMEIQNRDNFPGLQIHAKSGTAQVFNDDPHAWYVGYITNPGYPYAFVVIVENGGGGTAVAAPIANRVLQNMVG